MGCLFSKKDIDDNKLSSVHTLSVSTNPPSSLSSSSSMDSFSSGVVHVKIDFVKTIAAWDAVKEMRGLRTLPVERKRWRL